MSTDGYSLETILELINQNEELKRINEQLIKENEELKRRIEQNSNNSSKPPSTDPPWKKNNKKKPKSSRSIGGQIGHKRHIHKMQPDLIFNETVDVKPTECAYCKAKLTGNSAKPQIHVVYDLNKLSLKVTQYRFHSLMCSCGLITHAVHDDSIPKSIFGDGFVVLVGVLTGKYRLSRRNTVQFISELIGVSISLGMIIKLEKRLNSHLALVVDEVSKAMKEVPSVHVDETTWRKKGKMVWIWAVVAKFMCYYRISDRRNKEAAQIALGKDYKGFVTSDRYGAYLYIHESKRQVCWSHLDRQFEEFASAKGHSGFFGQEMMRLTDKMFREWKHVRDGTITRREFYKAAQIEIEAPMIMLIKQGREYGNSRVKAMCGDILRHHLPSLFNFARHDGIEPTNNVAERALRFDVILRKLSFGSWSDSGCEYISRISTVRETCRLQNRSFYEYLNSLIRSIRHGMPLPTLVAV